MYDLLLVKRRRRRKIAALLALICSIGVSSLVTVSFLGQYTGTFTVSLTNSSVKLSLCDKEAFDNPTTYLRVEKLDEFEEYTYKSILRDQLDDETKEYNIGSHYNDIAKKNVLSYFKYTFYVGNLGGKTAQYNLKINLLERGKSIDGTERTLDDTLRVMVYENDIDDPTNTGVHTTEVYAKEAAKQNIDKYGNVTLREFIAESDVQEDERHPLATSFESSSVIKTYKRGGFGQGQIRRYTIVMWLEGEDPQSLPTADEPVGASLKLGVEITAYENE